MTRKKQFCNINRYKHERNTEFLTCYVCGIGLGESLVNGFEHKHLSGINIIMYNNKEIKICDFCVEDYKNDKDYITKGLKSDL